MCDPKFREKRTARTRWSSAARPRSTARAVGQVVVDDQPLPLDAQRIENRVEPRVQLRQVLGFVVRRGDHADHDAAARPADFLHGPRRAFLRSGQRFDRFRHRRHDDVLLRGGHRRVERQQDRVILRADALAQAGALLAFGAAIQTRRARPRLQCVRRLAVRAHDAAAGRDAAIEHSLHHRALIDARGQPHAVALPVGARPRAARRAACMPVDAGEQRVRSARPARGAAGDDLRQPLQAARARPPPACRSCR